MPKEHFPYKIHLVFKQTQCSTEEAVFVWLATRKQNREFVQKYVLICPIGTGTHAFNVMAEATHGSKGNNAVFVLHTVYNVKVLTVVEGVAEVLR